MVGDAHYFRTWVERCVSPEGEDHARVDSHADPLNIAASGSEAEYRLTIVIKTKGQKAFFVPKICNHCTHPACVQVRPVGAIFRTEDGVVLIDHYYCIGCRYCVQACPYGARFFNEETGVTDKCTWCYHRITKGLQPACVEVCPTKARLFGDLNDSSSPVSQFIRGSAENIARKNIAPKNIAPVGPPTKPFCRRRAPAQCRASAQDSVGGAPRGDSRPTACPTTAPTSTPKPIAPRSGLLQNHLQEARPCAVQGVRAGQCRRRAPAAIAGQRPAQPPPQHQNPNPRPEVGPPTKPKPKPIAPRSGLPQNHLQEA